MSPRAAVLLLGLAIAVALPEVAWSCPVCNSNAEEEGRIAFIATTVFLSALPVAMIGVGAWFVWRRIRRLEQAPRRPAHRAPGLRREHSAS